MRPSRLPFLPTFFAALAVAFGVAVVMRIGSHGDGNILRRGEAVGTALPGRPGPAEPVLVTAPTNADSVGSLAAPPRNAPYRELLTSPIPAVAASVPVSSTPAATQAATTATAGVAVEPKPTPAKAGIVARLTGPIIAALSGSAATAAPPPVVRQEIAPPKEKDPTSDSTPPQLLSIEFVPAQVHDGEEVLLTVVVNDDLSGVRSVSGSVASPTGGLIGFALAREGDGGRYASRVRIPKDAPDGVWRTNSLNLSDHASNTAILTSSQGTIPPSGSFRVLSAGSDTTPPVLRALRLEKPSMKAGDRNLIYIEAEDDKTGVAMVTGVFHSPSRNARVGFGCRNTGQLWECDFMPPPSADCGDWQLEQIQLQDKANNTAWARSDNPLVGGTRINLVSEQCDAQPPTLVALAVDRQVVVNVQDNVITVSARVTDDASGVESVSGHVIGPTDGTSAPRLYFSLGAMPNEPGTWTGPLTVPKSAAKGTWAIASVQLLDKARNLKVYSRADPLLAAAQFRVE